MPSSKDSKSRKKKKTSGRKRSDKNYGGQLGHKGETLKNVVMNINVTEYRAKVLEDFYGIQYLASFPEHITKAV